MENKHEIEELLVNILQLESEITKRENFGGGTVSLVKKQEKAIKRLSKEFDLDGEYIITQPR